MLTISFNSVLIVAVIAVLVPVILGLLPRLPVPGAVLEVIAGIVIGPSVLGWVRVDAPGPSGSWPGGGPGGAEPPGRARQGR